MALAVVTVLAPAALIGWLILGGSDGSPSSSDATASGSGSGSSSTPGPTSDPVTTAPASPGEPNPLDPAASIPALQPVPLQNTVSYENGVTLSIDSVASFDAVGQGVGQVNGPALRITITITNGTAEELNLDTVAVNLATGPDLTPASPVSDPSATPFTGTVASGGSAAGGYSFTVPTDSRDSVTVTVNYTSGAVAAIFTGAVS